MPPGNKQVTGLSFQDTTNNYSNSQYCTWSVAAGIWASGCMFTKNCTERSSMGNTWGVKMQGGEACHHLVLYCVGSGWNQGTVQQTVSCLTRLTQPGFLCLMKCRSWSVVRSAKHDGSQHACSTYTSTSDLTSVFDRVFQHLYCLHHIWPTYTGLVPDASGCGQVSTEIYNAPPPQTQPWTLNNCNFRSSHMLIACQLSCIVLWSILYRFQFCIVLSTHVLWLFQTKVVCRLNLTRELNPAHFIRHLCI